MRLKLFLFMIVLSMILVACQSEDEPAEEEDDIDNLEEEENGGFADDEENSDSTEEDMEQANDEHEENEGIDTERDQSDADEQGDLAQLEEMIEEAMLKEDTLVEFQNINFTVPAGSIEVDLSDSPLPAVGFIIDYSTGANFNIIMEPLPEEHDLNVEEFIELVLLNYEFDLISRDSFKINGIDYVELVSDAYGSPLNQISLVHDHTAYTVSFSAITQDEYEEALPVLLDIINSIEIVGEDSE